MAVARKMVEIGKKYNLDDEQLQELFLFLENCEVTNALESLKMPFCEVAKEV